MTKPISQSTLGILGGGQLGRMLIQSAIDFNLDVKVLDPDPNSPCKDLTSDFQCGSLKDYDKVLEFGKDCDHITIEIESVNTEALKVLRDQGKEVYPEPEVIELIQDKRKQKTFYKANRIPTAEFVLTENRNDLKGHESFLPAVHKLGRDGYDGRGVQIIRNAQDFEKGFDAPGLLEKLVDFKKEIAVIVARSKTGEVKAFPAVELVFHPEANLVEYLFAPAEITAEQAEKAQNIAKEVINKLNLTGILAVEMFLTSSGEILVNEVAPRPHNSGHQSIEANYVSQYEQHLRAIYGLPLGATTIKAASAMINLLGEEGYKGDATYEGLDQVLTIPGVSVHLYGKKETKPFRKMGHVTIVDNNLDSLKKKAIQVKEILKVKA